MDEKRPLVPPVEQVTGGDSNKITRMYLDQWLIAYRHIGAVQPDTHFTLFGETFETPIMVGGMAAMVPAMHEGGMAAIAKGAKEAGSVFWSGYVSDEEFAEACRVGAKAIRIIKPMQDMHKVLDAIAHDEECGAFGFAMDIDHGLDDHGNFFPAVPGAYDTLSPKTEEDIYRMTSSTKLPFIAKGVLHAEDAKACVRAGAKAILMSHHKGEYPYAVPPLMMLPEIREAVGDDIPIFVDCGIQSGHDVFKALAIGANTVCIARPFIGPFKENGAEGVRTKIDLLNAELKGVMGKTASKDLDHMHRDVLRWRNW